jgi:hypothetical protein
VYFFTQSGLNVRVGETVPAHIHGNHAFTTNASFDNVVVPILIGGGFLVGFPIFRYIRRRATAS